MVKFIPALFSSLMVPAILDGTKTKTRRVVTIPKDDIKEATWGYTAFTPERHISFRAKHASGEYGESFVKCPYGKKGDVLWVREEHYRYGHWKPIEKTNNGRQKWKFVQDDPEVLYNDKKPSSIFKSRDKNNPRQPHWYKRLGRFMPKSACRIFLEIQSITVERLQDIKSDDAIAEGIEQLKDFSFAIYRNYRPEVGCNDGYQTPEWSFMSLWKLINGEDSWKANPFVWVVTFKKVDKPALFNA